MDFVTDSHSCGIETRVGLSPIELLIRIVADFDGTMSRYEVLSLHAFGGFHYYNS